MRVILLAALLTGGAAAMVQSNRPPLANISELGFMAGCWRGPSSGGAVIDEYYTAPSENMLLGVSRYTKDGRVVNFEFTTVTAQGDTNLLFTARPSGQEPGDFNLTALKPGHVVWSNPRHDFPQVITYRRVGADSLVARIEGPGESGTRSMEWRMKKVRCEP
jgi:hypothetical protein